MFNLLLKKSLKAHEIIKLSIIKDLSKYLKWKIYFTLSSRCYIVNKNIKKLQLCK